MKTNKANKFAVTVFMVLCAILGSAISASSETRSYAAWQVLTQGPYGPIADVPQNQSGWVMWSSDGQTLTMSDGTQWRFLQDRNGYHHYKYTGCSGAAMPNTQYDQVVFNYDYSTMAMFYSFGMPGMMIQMRSDWRYIGDGTQPAYDWMTGNF